MGICWSYSQMWTSARLAAAHRGSHLRCPQAGAAPPELLGPVLLRVMGTRHPGRGDGTPRSGFFLGKHRDRKSTTQHAPWPEVVVDDLTGFSMTASVTASGRSWCWRTGPERIRVTGRAGCHHAPGSGMAKNALPGSLHKHPGKAVFCLLL